MVTVANLERAGSCIPNCLLAGVRTAGRWVLRRSVYVSMAGLAAWLFCVELMGGHDAIPSSLGQQGFEQPKAFDVTRICTQNPYRQALQQGIDTVAAHADEWLLNTTAQLQHASQRSMGHHTWDRFFVFNPTATSFSKSCLGGNCKSGESKVAFGIDQLKPGCIVYSIGSNNRFDFEISALKDTPCEVHTFDCTGPKERFDRVPVHERMHFHWLCLGDKPEEGPKRCQGREKCGNTSTLLEIQRDLKHTQIDLLKMDIEGFEWNLFDSWPELENQANSEQLLLPMQVLVEIHYRTQFKVLNTQEHGQDFKSPQDLVRLQAHFLKMGYAVVNRADNPACRHCTELTMTRFRCPGAGAYN